MPIVKFLSLAFELLVLGRQLVHLGLIPLKVYMASLNVGLGDAVLPGLRALDGEVELLLFGLVGRWPAGPAPSVFFDR